MVVEGGSVEWSDDDAVKSGSNTGITAEKNDKQCKKSTE